MASNISSNPFAPLDESPLKILINDEVPQNYYSNHATFLVPDIVQVGHRLALTDT